MDKELHERAFEIFERACDLPKSEQEAMVDRECGNDTDLHREVSALLAHDRSDLDFDAALVQPARAALAETSSVNDEHEKLPSQLGQYRILGRLGVGGMGEVYEAEQESPKRRVALKIIRAAHLLKSLIRRFEHEAFLLGQLRHPGIAHIYESGMVVINGQRQPFFAMEIIDGVPLGLHVDQNKLSIPQRLELIARICDAVQHAHQKGIIHRDLKPQNIMVVADEHNSDGNDAKQDALAAAAPMANAVGQPKILDFGVARVVDHDQAGMTLQTEAGQIIGTLGYMSPEQLSGNTADLDTRCDVYALGVMLYEVLAGKQPHDLTSLSLTDSARVIQEQDPLPVGAIDRQLRGDIETIVTKAMEKDRERRYESAAALAADVRRFLSHQPIEARPASTIYQLGRFARRNRGLVGGMVATFVALIVGLAGTGYFLLEAQAQSAAATQAQRESGQVVEFQSAQLAGIDIEAMAQQMRADLLSAIPDEHRDAVQKQLADVNFADYARTTLATNIFTPSLNAIEKQFASQPKVQAQLLETLSDTTNSLGLIEFAEEPWRKALAIHEKVHGRDSQQYIETLCRIGNFLVEQGRFQEADPVIREAREASRIQFGRFHPAYAYATNTLAGLHNARDELPQAKAVLTEHLAEMLKEPSVEPELIRNNRSVLSAILLKLGELEAAEPHIRFAYDESVKLYGKEDPKTLNAQRRIASLLRMQGKLPEAIELLEKNRQVRLRVVGETHPDTLATTGLLGSLYYRTERYSEAAELYKFVLLHRTETFGPHHPDVILSKENLGAALMKLDQPSASINQYLEALVSRRITFGDDHPKTLLAVKVVADFLFNESRFEESERMYLEATAGAISLFGAGHKNTLMLLKRIAQIKSEQDTSVEPVALYALATHRCREVFGENHRFTWSVQRGSASMQAEQGNIDIARESLTKLLARQIKSSSASESQIEQTQRLIKKLESAN